MPLSRQKLIGLSWQAFAYTMAIVAAVFVFQLLAEYSVIWRIFTADIAATVIIFFFSKTFNNSSFYDPYWSIKPVVIAVGLYIISWENYPFSRQEAVLSLVLLYGARLTFNFFRSWPGLEHQDWRYDDLQSQHGSRYWLVSFFGIHLFPTLLVFGGSLSLLVVYLWPVNSWNWLDGLGIIVTAAGIWIEHQADSQLFSFKRSAPPKQALLDTGLWAQFRHPNYLGEILVWWGLFLFALAANPAYWWVLLGPLSIHLLFVFISIPMKDKRMLNSRPSYATRMKEVPALWPKRLS